MKLKESFVKDLLNQYTKEEISFSKMVELLNKQFYNNCSLNGWFKVKKEFQDHRGERYFSINEDKPKITQLCLSTGKEEKRGRGHNIGITTITKNSLTSNYTRIIESCTEDEYFSKFSELMEKLK